MAGHTVSPASASPVNATATWYDLSNPFVPAIITSYDFGEVPVGTTAHAVLLLVIAPWDINLDSASPPTTTAPFSIDTSLFDICDPNTYCQSILAYFTPTSLGSYSEDLVVDYQISVIDPQAILPLNGVGVSPLPGALPLFASGLGALGLLGWRRKRKKVAALAA